MSLETIQRSLQQHRLVPLQIRLPKNDKTPIEKVCKLRHENLSSFTRRAILRELARLGFLSEEEQQALEIQGNHNDVDARRIQ